MILLLRLILLRRELVGVSNTNTEIAQYQQVIYLPAMLIDIACKSRSNL